MSNETCEGEQMMIKLDPGITSAALSDTLLIFPTKSPLYFQIQFEVLAVTLSENSFGLLHNTLILTLGQ